MDTFILIYSYSVSLLLWFSIGLSDASDLKPVECNASVSMSQSMDLPEIMVRAEHLYSSVTNGSPYSKGPNPAGDVRLGGNVTFGSLKVDVTNSLLQTVTFAYNGTHICSSAQQRLEKDTCWAGSSTGCFNKTNTCDSVCFRANDLFERHTLKLFGSNKASSGIGTWSMSDYLRIYTAPANQLTCHYGAESYQHWKHWTDKPTYPNLTKMKCPIGQRCRVTVGQYMLSDPIQTFIGCETDSNQFGGCEEGCKWRKDHLAPSGRRENWAHMCKYCCFEDLCNNPFKCKNLDCNLTSILDSSSETPRNTATSVLDSSSESPQNSADSFLRRLYNIYNFIVTIVLVALFKN